MALIRQPTIQSRIIKTNDTCDGVHFIPYCFNWIENMWSVKMLAARSNVNSIVWAECTHTHTPWVSSRQSQLSHRKFVMNYLLVGDVKMRYENAYWRRVGRSDAARCSQYSFCKYTTISSPEIHYISIFDGGGGDDDGDSKMVSRGGASLFTKYLCILAR